MSIAELAGAKELVRQDPSMYPTIVENLLPLADRPEIAMRRWIALFFMDAVTSLELAESIKTDISLKILPKLVDLVKDSDPQVVKIALGCASHSYAGIFDYLCKNQNEQHIWNSVASIKRTSSALWDGTSHIGVKAACIKLAQIVVQTQSRQESSGLIEVSLMNVPPNHAFLDPVILLAESDAFLDRMLGYFSENTIHPAILSASINAALTLVKTRPRMANKIISSICSMNLMQKTGLNTQVDVRYVDKTLQLDLKDVARNYPAHVTQIGKFLARISEYTASSNLRKRAATQGNEDSSKRVKLAQNDWPTRTNTQLPEGTHPLSELYKLVDPANVLAQFNSRDLPVDVAVKIALSGIKNANSTLLKNCISIIYQRAQGTEIVSPEKEDEQQKETTLGAQSSNPQEDTTKDEEVLTITLPETDETTKQTTDMINRVVVAASQSPAGPEEEGLNRNIKWSKDTWVYLVSRIATRAVPQDSPVATRVRDYLYKYVMTDFRKHLDLIVIWLSEEWYSENILYTPSDESESFYFDTLAHIIEQILPRMEVSDSKMFIRLLSDVPALNAAIIDKLQSVCQDPDRSLLGFRALKFLIMFKPPIKEACLDLVVKLNEQSIDGAAAILKRYRPDALA